MVDGVTRKSPSTISLPGAERNRNWARLLPGRYLFIFRPERAASLDSSVLYLCRSVHTDDAGEEISSRNQGIASHRRGLRWH